MSKSKKSKSTRTKKYLGQHWLFDGPSLQAIIDASSLSADDTVLEIGPGRGPLTELLSQKVSRVVAVEKDSDLVPTLKVQFILQENVEIIEADILSFDLRELPSDYVVVANIPYYLTSAIVRLLMESTNPPKKLVLLIQKEVAERICSEPGQMSVLALSVQLYAKAEYVATVTRDKFQPPPKVDSAILRLTRLEKPVLDVEPQKFMQLVKAGFGEKRKTIRNSLAGGLRISAAEATQLLNEAGIAESARAQELTFEQWNSLYKALSKKSK